MSRPTIGRESVAVSRLEAAPLGPPPPVAGGRLGPLQRPRSPSDPKQIRRGRPDRAQAAITWVGSLFAPAAARGPDAAMTARKRAPPQAPASA
ncbi:hypothetical protein PR003_g15018 [Phytophthora rubi]|uniref:Uncharacterized protein n=2 Tax=Phytophthora TaxID=4783 RepID=A0A6A4F2I1_9STRA|nr:hypothetical protein PF003_g4693 [Phytophthora fragariae]KAE9305928.1 hypothetical protein PF008_g21596 [Phytophthora fragariae]KAE9331433.1 hypothetical protein PR003_g15018 [Phytophthora rubi]